jgi:hypothetical protein
MRTITITRGAIEKYEPRTRDFKDRRKFVSRITVSYWHGSDEYRKSFTGPVGYTASEIFEIMAPKTMDINTYTK